MAQYGRRHTSFTQEGFYLAFILLFILGGAVMRQINPLFLLGGLLIAAYLFNWRLGMAMLRYINVERRLPPRAAAGETFVVTLRATNQRTRLESWNLTFRDTIKPTQIRDYPISDKQLELKIDSLISNVPCLGAASCSYRATIHERGIHTFGPLSVMTRFPFGLTNSWFKFAPQNQILVSPRLGELRNPWRRFLQRERVLGQTPLRQQGATEGDFYSLRQWRNGDSRRWIHWRSSARLGQLVVQQFEKQNERHVCLLLDLWKPAEPTANDLDQVETIASFLATAVVSLCRSSAGDLTIGLFGAESHWHAGTPSRPFQNLILDALATIQPSSAPELSSAWDRLLRDKNATQSILIVTSRTQESVEAIIRDDQSLAELMKLNQSTHVQVLSVKSPDFSDWYSLGEVVPKSLSESTKSASKQEAAGA